MSLTRLHPDLVREIARHLGTRDIVSASRASTSVRDALRPALDRRRRLTAAVRSVRSPQARRDRLMRLAIAKGLTHARMHLEGVPRQRAANLIRRHWGMVRIRERDPAVGAVDMLVDRRANGNVRITAYVETFWFEMQLHPGGNIEVERGSNPSQNWNASKRRRYDGWYRAMLSAVRRLTARRTARNGS